MKKIFIHSGLTVNHSARVTKWFARIESAAQDTLKRIDIGSNHFCLSFAKLVPQDLESYPIVRVVASDGKNLAELLGYVPKKLTYLSFYFELSRNAELKTIQYGPLEVRFESKTIPQFWDEVAQVIGFHSVLAISRELRNSAYSKPLVHQEMMRLSPSKRLTIKVFKAVLNRLTGRNKKLKQWSIGLFDKNNANGDLLSFGSSDVKWIETPSDRFWADPQLYAWNNVPYLFYEELIYQEGIGKLFVVPIDAEKKSLSGKPIEVTFLPAIDQHLSFPNLFEHDGSLWMLPENSQSGKTNLYKCTEFPNKWKLHRTLLTNVAGIDPVVFFNLGVVYLFVTDGSLDNYDNNLRLFHSDSLFSEFIEHPQSPIALGLVGSRMGGNLIEQNGNLLRVAQNCSVRYGGSIEVFEVVKLTTTEYEERYVRTIEPDPDGPYPLGLHTFSTNDAAKLSAIDGLRLVDRS